MLCISFKIHAVIRKKYGKIVLENVSPFIKTSMLPRIPSFDVNTAPKLSSDQRRDVGALQQFLKHFLTNNFSEFEG